MINDIDQAIEIAAPIERVWRVLTEEGLVEQWLGCMAYRGEIGAVFYMQPDPARRAAGDLTGATHCELLALEPPRRMAFSWYYPHTPKTTVEITLSETAGVVVARLTHTGWDRFKDEEIRAVRDMLDGGWSGFVLPGLKRVAEAG